MKTNWKKIIVAILKLAIAALSGAAGGYTAMM